MTTRLSLTTVALLAVGLVLAACTTQTEMAAEVEHPTDPTGKTTATAAPLATSGQLPTASPPPPTPTPTEMPTAEPTATAGPTLILPDLGPAPDITNEIWLNSDQPLNLELLKGEVVLVDFWTFG